MDNHPASPVLVFNLGQNPIQHGRLAVIRTLGRMGVDEVYAVEHDRLAPVAASRYLRRAFAWTTETEASDRVAERLLTIAREIGRRTVLLPTDDRGAVFVAEHADLLREGFVFPRVPGSLPRRLANKREMYGLCDAIGFPCPKAIVPQSPADVSLFIEQARFPVIVKAADAQRLPKGARSTSIARTADELLRLAEQVATANAPNVILQECIPERDGEDWIFHAYSNPDTGCFVWFTGRKLRSYPVLAGPTTLGIPVVNETLCRQTEQLLRATGYAGIMDLDYRLDYRDGRYKLLDFNPRCGANFRMFEDSAGVDVVRALYLDLTGHLVSPSPPVKQRTFVDDCHDAVAGLGYLRRGSLTLREWGESLKGKKELAWFCPDDPLPAAVMWCRLLSRTARRAVLAIWKSAAAWARARVRPDAGGRARRPPACTPVTSRSRYSSSR